MRLTTAGLNMIFSIWLIYYQEGISVKWWKYFQLTYGNYHVGNNHKRDLVLTDLHKVINIYYHMQSCKQSVQTYMTWGSRDGDYEDGCLLGCSAV
jgi:hypothetical protein